MSKGKEWVPDEQMKQAVRRNLEAIDGSEMFLCIWNDRMAEEVLPLIQMGLAVYLDKPVYLLVPESSVLKIPQNIRNLARRLEVYPDHDLAGLEHATQRLISASRDKK